MSPKEILESNLVIVSEVAPDIVGRFYAELFRRHPELQKLFGRRSASAQQKMVLDAIVAVVEHMEDPAWLRSTLRPMGAKHLTYGVRDEMYPLVANALVATLRDASGAHWSETIERTWAGALGAVAGEMIAGAREAEAAPTSRRSDAQASP